MPLPYKTAVPVFLQGAWSTLVSVLVALLPKCGLCLAAYLNLFNILGISVAKYFVWILPLLLGLLLLSLYIAFLKARKLSDYRAFALSVAGATLLLTGKILLKYMILSWTGIGLLLTGTIIQLAQTRKICSRTVFRRTAPAGC